MGEGGVAGEGKRVRVGAACAVHSCLRIARRALLIEGLDRFCQEGSMRIISGVR